MTYSARYTTTLVNTGGETLTAFSFTDDTLPAGAEELECRVDGAVVSDFTFDGTIRDIYDASGSDAFAADDSDVKIARTDTEMRDPENSGLWLRLYKIYVKSEYIAQNDVAVAFGV